MSQATLITGAERRRRWSEERKFELVAEAFSQAGSVAAVARREDISPGLIYRWRKTFLDQREPVSFTPAVLTEPAAGLSRREPAAVVVDLASGARVRMRGSAPLSLVVAVLKALA